MVPLAGDLLRRFLTSTWGGRTFVAGLFIKAVTTLTGTSHGVLALLDRVGAAALVFGGSYLVYRVFEAAQGRLLWRVRRKLTLSYMFIAVVPVLLLAVFFALCGLLLLFNGGSYLVQSRLRDLQTEAQVQVRTTAVEIQGARIEGLQTVLARRYATVQTRFPGASMAVVPIGGNPPCGVNGQSQIGGGVPSAQIPILIGPWTHVSPPRTVPQWLNCDGFSGLLAYQWPGAGGDARILVRSVSFARDASPAFSVVIDIPIDDDIVGRLREDTRVLVPDGMMLGVKLDRGERFEQLLEEATLPLAAGDLFVFFTDGISEAMKEQSDCFGESRLGRLVAEHAHLPVEELRERILREIHSFAGSAAQHDDMTMILLKVDEIAVPLAGAFGIADTDVSLASARSGA